MKKTTLTAFLTLSFMSLNLWASDSYEACIKWTAPLPIAGEPSAGLELLSGVKHYTIFPGSKELGMFNHGPMLAFFEERLYVVWYSHSQYEDAPGTRALFSYSLEKVRQDHSQLKHHQQMAWAEPQVLIDSIGDMTEKDKLGTAMWPVFEEVNGRLYVMPTVKQIIGWQGSPTSPIYKDLPRVAKYLSRESKNQADIYWLADTSPEGYEFIKPFNKADDASLLTDLAALKQRLDTRNKHYAYPKSADGARFCEPTYFNRPDGKEVGIYRDLERSLRLYAAIRDNSTSPWSMAVQTNIFDSPSKTVAGNLPDGRVFIIGNFLDKLWLRDPIIIGLSDDGITFDKAYTIRAGASQVREKNPGDHKGPGFQYPDAVVVGDSLWVSYSISKEQIAISRIPIDSLK